MIITLFISCGQSNNENIAKSPKSQISELAQRYFELGRFSGTILIQKDDEIYFRENFGYADNMRKIPFTSETSFNLGHFSYYFAIEIQKELLLSSLSGKNEDVDIATDKALLKLSQKLDLENTFYLENSNKPSALGHSYSNKGNGLEWHEYEREESDTIKIREFHSTPMDFLKLLNNSSTKELFNDSNLINGGFNYLVNKKDSLTIIIFSNARHPIAGEINTSIEAILNDKPYYIPYARKSVELDSEILKNYEGVYKFDENSNIDIFYKNDSLFSSFNSMQFYLTSQSNNQFYMPGMDAELRFVMEENDIVGLELLDGFKEGRIIPKN
jgi:hypothetical protein